MKIKVLGMGCMNCKNLYSVTNDAAKELELEYTLDKVENMKDIMAYGVMRTPALVIDEKVVLQGRIPSKEEMKKILIENNDLL